MCENFGGEVMIYEVRCVKMYWKNFGEICCCLGMLWIFKDGFWEVN